jgi:SSS family solute:Na+ symporter
VLLVPYIIIGIMGGGKTLHAISGEQVPEWFGGAVVALVVMSYVFFGGMRGTAWVNTFQTVLFLIFGAIALAVIGIGMGGFAGAVESMQTSPALAPLLTRERISPYYFFSYTFCLTARKMSQFKKTVIFYPLCIAAIWLPCVFLGVMANRATDVEAIREKQEARRLFATEGKTMSPEARDQLRERASGDDVIMRLLTRYAPVLLAGMLGAGIMAAVMASDSQILALSTMFTEDVFAWYGGKQRFGEIVQVQTGRIFVILLTLVAYAIAQRTPERIFELAIQYALSGFAALSPLLVAALFWRGSTKWGALAATVWTISAVIAVAVFQAIVPTPPPGVTNVIWSVGGTEIFARKLQGGTTVFGFLPVVPMVLVSALLMFVVSVLTKKPSAATVEKYFPVKDLPVTARI